MNNYTYREMQEKAEKYDFLLNFWDLLDWDNFEEALKDFYNKRGGNSESPE